MKVAIRALLFTAVVAIGLMTTNMPVSAADARKFNPGRIIDDTVFTNSNSMTVAQIQAFLDSKMPKCDTYGTERAGGGSSSITNRQWIEKNYGISPPYRCVRDYKENPDTGSNNYGKTSTPAGALSSAELIYKYSKMFNINPQVLLVTLQKENGLITDNIPIPKNYNEAMGFGCPDNRPAGAPACDPAYGSFSTQLYQAARHFRGFIDSPPGWYVPFNTGRNSIQWHPSSSCGARDVYIENRATVALYSYTPYQPNQAALNAQYGVGNSCSSYGNRNFYLFFTDWFGSVYGDVHIIAPLTLRSSGPQGMIFSDSSVEASFVVRNDSRQKVNLGKLAVAGRDSKGNNYDFGSEDIVLLPGQQHVFKKSRNLPKEDKYTFWITSYREGVGWDDDYPSVVGGHVRRLSNQVVMKTPTITAEPKINTQLHKGESGAVEFSVKNNSSVFPVNLGRIGVAIRSSDGSNADLPFDTISSLGPGETFHYSKPFTPRQSGDYRAYISTFINGSWNESSYPGINSGLTRSVNFKVKDSITLVGGITISDTSPYVGDSVDGSFKIKNFSASTVSVDKDVCLIMRGAGKNYDFGCQRIKSMKPGQELLFESTRTLKDPGVYKAYFSMFDGKRWHDNWVFESESGEELKTVKFTARTNPTLTQGLTIETESPVADEPTVGVFRVKNNSKSSIAINKDLCFIVRRSGDSKNYDFGCLRVRSLDPNEEAVFRSNKTLPAGEYRAYFSMFDGKKWMDHRVFDRATGDEATEIKFTVKTNPVLIQGLSMDSSRVQVGTPMTGEFRVKNMSRTSTVSVNNKLCYIVRGPGGLNFDYGCLDIKSIKPQEELQFIATKTPTVPGVYRAYFSTYDGSIWNDHKAFDGLTGSENTSLEFTVTK